MAPVNPYAAPPAVPVGQPSGPAPVRSAPAAPAGFTAGLDAPRATPRLSDLITSQPVEARPAEQGRSAAPAAASTGARTLFSLQQLSAYAGLVMEADDPVQPAGEGTRTASAPAGRPLRPGSRLDVTV